MIDHGRPHPNKTAATQAWAAGRVLHVAAAYSNPCRYDSRRELFNDFRRHLESLPNVRLYVGELAYGDRPFQVTSPDCPTDFRFRSGHELWHKENLLNLVVQRFAPGWEYGAYIDGDFHFHRRDLGLEAVQVLQHHPWAQLFAEYADLGPDGRTLGPPKPGFVYALSAGLDLHGKPTGRYGRPGSPGGAWCFRRSAFDACGGLLDCCVLGSADYHMAVGLTGWRGGHPDTRITGPYRDAIRVWQDRADRATNRDVGFVPGFATHGFHGPRSKRGYDTRWRVLRDHGFDPARDLYRDWQGVWQLTPGKPALRDAIRAYFRSRHEDDIRTA